MIVLQNKDVKDSGKKRPRGTFKIVFSLSIIVLKASVFQALGADRSSSFQQEDLSKGDTFVNVYQGGKFTGNVDDLIRQMQSRHLEKKPVDFSELMPNKNYDNAKVNLNDLSLENCTTENGRLISGKITKGEMLYEGTVYPTGSQFLDGKCVYNPSAPKG